MRLFPALAAITALVVVVISGLATTEANSLVRNDGGTKPREFVVVCALYTASDVEGRKLAKVPITYDPRFAILAKVEEVVAGSAPWRPGEKVLFLIHSPALMFGRYRFGGERFRFTFQDLGTSAKDCRYCVAKLASEPAKGSPANPADRADGNRKQRGSRRSSAERSASLGEGRVSS